MEARRAALDLIRPIQWRKPSGPSAFCPRRAAAGNVRTQTSFLLYTISRRMSTVFSLFYQVCGILQDWRADLPADRHIVPYRISQSSPVIPPPLHKPTPNHKRFRTHLRPPSAEVPCGSRPAWGTVLSRIRLASHSISASSTAACPLSRRMTK